jgi:hypothetical protein
MKRHSAAPRRPGPPNCSAACRRASLSGRTSSPRARSPGARSRDALQCPPHRRSRSRSDASRSSPTALRKLVTPDLDEFFCTVPRCGLSHQCAVRAARVWRPASSVDAPSVVHDCSSEPLAPWKAEEAVGRNDVLECVVSFGHEYGRRVVQRREGAASQFLSWVKRTIVRSLHLSLPPFSNGSLPVLQGLSKLSFSPDFLLLLLSALSSQYAPPRLKSSQGRAPAARPHPPPHVRHRSVRRGVRLELARVEARHGLLTPGAGADADADANASAARCERRRHPASTR